MLKAAARLTSLLVVIAGFAAAQPVLADSETDISTPAWTNYDLALYKGPGRDFPVKTVLPGGIRIHVDRCSQLWCKIHTGRSQGFAFLYSLSFGQGPNSIWWPSQVRHPHIYIGGPLHGQFRSVPLRKHRW